jgi:hypothetical protein
MKILSKAVSDRFQSFYKDTIPRIGIPITFERGSHGAMGQYRRENGIARINLDTSLIEPHFEQTAAHELLHAVQDSELWPDTARSVNLSDNSPEAVVGTELASLVRDLSVLETLQMMGFETEYSNNVRYENAMKKLKSAPIPKQGSPMWCLWVIRYAYLCLTQPKRKWHRLSEIYVKRAPSIATKGEELITVVNKNGWSNPDQALASMIAIRGSLGINEKQVIIRDPRARNTQPIAAQ